MKICFPDLLSANIELIGQIQNQSTNIQTKPRLESKQSKRGK